MSKLRRIINRTLLRAETAQIQEEENNTFLGNKEPLTKLELGMRRLRE
jgi:hypothetical protein